MEESGCSLVDRISKCRRYVIDKISTTSRYVIDIIGSDLFSLEELRGVNLKN